MDGGSKDEKQCRSDRNQLDRCATSDPPTGRHTSESATFKSQIKRQEASPNPLLTQLCSTVPATIPTPIQNPQPLLQGPFHPIIIPVRLRLGPRRRCPERHLSDEFPAR